MLALDLRVICAPKVGQKKEKMKYSPMIATKLSEMVVKGKRSVCSVCREYPTLDEKELRLWCALYREYGQEVFMSNQEFGLTLRKDIILDKISNGLSLLQTCVKYRILRRSSLKNWLRSYKSGHLMKQSTKRKKANSPLSSETEKIKQLEEELFLVKAENAYLKKLQALMQQGKKN